MRRSIRRSRSSVSSLPKNTFFIAEVNGSGSGTDRSTNMSSLPHSYLPISSKKRQLQPARVRVSHSFAEINQEIGDVLNAVNKVRDTETDHIHRRSTTRSRIPSFIKQKTRPPRKSSEKSLQSIHLHSHVPTGFSRSKSMQTYSGSNNELLEPVNLSMNQKQKQKSSFVQGKQYRKKTLERSLSLVSCASLDYNDSSFKEADTLKANFKYLEFYQTNKAIKCTKNCDRKYEEDLCPRCLEAHKRNWKFVISIIKGFTQELESLLVENEEDFNELIVSKTICKELNISNGYSILESTKDALTVPLTRYLFRLVKYMETWYDKNHKGIQKHAGVHCLFMSCLYLKKIKASKNSKILFTRTNLYNLILGSFLIAAKYSEDDPISSKWWSEVGGIMPKQMEEIEMMLCKEMNFELFLNQDELAHLYFKYVPGLKFPEPSKTRRPFDAGRPSFGSLAGAPRKMNSFMAKSVVSAASEIEDIL